MSETTDPKPILIFDGDCGFCTMSINFVQRWIKPRARIVAWQLTDLDALGVTQQECAEAIQWIPRHGQKLSGGAAAAAALKSAPSPWPLLGALLDAPALRVVTDRAYKLIARNRYRLPGSTPACKVAALESAA